VLQPRSRIPETHTTSIQWCACFLHDAVSVPDLNLQFAFVLASEDLDAVLSFAFVNSVTDGVLNERLQDQGWHLLIEDRRIRVNLYCEALTKPPPLNADIEIENLQFTRKRNLVRFHLIERNSQQLAKTKKNVFGGPRILRDERNGRLKRIEEEVRL
jgi:hypothetical protein